MSIGYQVWNLMFIGAPHWAKLLKAIQGYIFWCQWSKSPTLLWPLTAWCPASVVHRPFTFFKQHLLWNHWPNSNQTLSEAAVPRGNEILLKDFIGVIPLVSMATEYKILKNLLRNQWSDFIFFFKEMFLTSLSFKVVQRIWFRQKTWPPWAGLIFTMLICLICLIYIQ